MNFERFYNYCKSLGVKYKIPAPLLMDDMEPLPLGLKWVTIFTIREGYGVNFCSQFFDEILASFRIVLSVFDTDKYVGLDGKLYDEIPKDWKREGNFVYDEECAKIFFNNIMKYFHQPDPVDKVKNAITDIQSSEVSSVKSTQQEMQQKLDDMFASSDEETTPVVSHSEVVEVLDKNEKSLKANGFKDLTEEPHSETKESEEEIEVASVANPNPFLHKDFLKDAKKEKDTYLLSKELASTLKDPNVFAYVSEDEVTVYKLSSLEKLRDKKKWKGKYYEDYRIWFDKGYKDYILWIFELDEKYNAPLEYESTIVDILDNRPPWKWIDTDTLEYVDAPTEEQNFQYMITGKRTHEVFKYLRENDVDYSFDLKELQVVAASIPFKSKMYDQIYSTPKGKFTNIDNGEYVKKAKHVDNEYWWCTDDDKKWKHRDNIRKNLLTTFLKRFDK